LNQWLETLALGIVDIPNEPTVKAPTAECRHQGNQQATHQQEYEEQLVFQAHRLFSACHIPTRLIIG